MTTLEALYLQEPFWIWLAAGALFVSLNLATGSSLLLWPSLAAAIIACVDLAGFHLGMPVEIGLFGALTAVAYGIVYGLQPTAKVAAAGPGPWALGPRPSPPRPPSAPRTRPPG